jgi:hypothetical protein
MFLLALAQQPRLVIIAVHYVCRPTQLCKKLFFPGFLQAMYRRQVDQERVLDPAGARDKAPEMATNEESSVDVKVPERWAKMIAMVNKEMRKSVTKWWGLRVVEINQDKRNPKYVY